MDVRTSLTATESAVLCWLGEQVDCETPGNLSAQERAGAAWSLPAGCTHQATGSPTPRTLSTLVRCTTSGVKHIYLDVDARVSASGQKPVTTPHVQLELTDTNLCYDWYVAPIPTEQSPPGPNDHFAEAEWRVWIYNYPVASESEQTGRACLPSTTSQTVTREYQALGESPRISLTGDYEALGAHHFRVEFDHDCACWIVRLTVPSTWHRSYASIDGQHIGILNCLVRPRKLALATNRWATGGSPAVLLAGLAGAAHWTAMACRGTYLNRRGIPDHSYTGATLEFVSPAATLAHCTCCSYVALLQWSNDSSPFGFVVWRNTFGDRTALVQFPSSLSTAASKSSCQIAATRPTADNAELSVMVACGPLVYHYDLTNNTWKDRTPWLSSGAIAQGQRSQVRTMDSCASHASWAVASTIIVWSQFSDSTVTDVEPLVLYHMTSEQMAYGSGWSRIGGLCLAITVRDSSGHDCTGWTLIATVLLDGSFPVVALVGRENSNQIQRATAHALFTYNRNGSWQTGARFGPSTAKMLSSVRVDGSFCSAGMVGVAAGTAEVYVWASKLWFSSDGGIHTNVISLEAMDGTALPYDGCIDKVETSAHSEVLVTTACKRRFWGYVGFPALIEIEQGEFAGESMLVNFDALGQIIAVQMPRINNLRDFAGSLTFESQLVPTASSVTRAVMKNAAVSCPYHGLRTTLPQVVFLDIGETVQGNVTLDLVNIFAAVDNTAAVSVSHSDIYGSLISLDVASARLNMWTVRTSIVVLAAPLQKVASASEHVAVTSRVTTRSLACGSSAVSTMHVNIGCPPGRHIRAVVEGVTKPCSDEPTAEEWIDPNSPYTVNRAKRNACMRSVTQMYHGTMPWRPKVVLYDYDIPIREVDADYIIFEQQGRWDFTFTETASQAQCVYPAQSTEQLFQGEDYFPCWESGINRHVDHGTAQDWQSLPYAVMNASSSNALQFTDPGGNGIFVFGLHVVANNYSNCALRTEFAVEVFGAPIDTFTSFLVTLTTLGTISLGLAISFILFRHSAEHWRHE
jgi:hypothetical protein